MTATPQEASGAAYLRPDLDISGRYRPAVRRRILVVQYAGDYREAYYRLRQGGRETYRGQRYTVEAVEEIGRRFGDVAILIYQTEEKFTEELPNGVTVFGMGIHGHPEDFSGIIEQIRAWRPSHLIQFCPSPEVLDWASAQGIRVLSMFGETAPTGNLRRWWRNRRLAKILNRPGIEWVGNHHLSATRWLQEIGVDKEKLVPFDYEYPESPASFEAKTLPAKTQWVIGYVGMLIDAKGVPDLIRAIAELHRSGMAVRLRLAGVGETGKYQQQASELGIGEQVEFLGLIANDQVHDFMRSADIMVVPSRHQYSEGFGFVVQEAFVSRSPLVVSDHRAFKGRVVDGENGLVFPAGNSSALANRLQQLLTDPLLYHRLSVNSAAAWGRMQIPVKWAKLIFRWLEDSEESCRWLWEHRLASGRYE